MAVVLTATFFKEAAVAPAGVAAGEYFARLTSLG